MLLTTHDRRALSVRGFEEVRQLVIQSLLRDHLLSDSHRHQIHARPEIRWNRDDRDKQSKHAAGTGPAYARGHAHVGDVVVLPVHLDRNVRKLAVVLRDLRPVVRREPRVQDHRLMTCDQTQSFEQPNSGMTIDSRQSKSSKRARSGVAEEGLWTPHAFSRCVIQIGSEPGMLPSVSQTFDGLLSLSDSSL